MEIDIYEAFLVASPKENRLFGLSLGYKYKVEFMWLLQINVFSLSLLFFFKSIKIFKHVN